MILDFTHATGLDATGARTFGMLCRRASPPARWHLPCPGHLRAASPLRCIEEGSLLVPGSVKTFVCREPSA